LSCNFPSLLCSLHLKRGLKKAQCFRCSRIEEFSSEESESCYMALLFIGYIIGEFFLRVLYSANYKSRLSLSISAETNVDNVTWQNSETGFVPVEWFKHLLLWLKTRHIIDLHYNLPFAYKDPGEHAANCK